MSNWTDVAAEADLFEGAGIPVAPGGRDIALFSVEGEVFATDNLCTHGNARLCDGFATLPPCTEAIKVWPVKLEGGRVFQDLG